MLETFGQVYNYPTCYSQKEKNLIISSITRNTYSAIIEFEYTRSESTGIYIYLSPPNSSGAYFIKANDKKYSLVSTNGIGNKDGITAAYSYKTIKFSATFEPIPETLKEFDLIEGNSGSWNFYGIKLKSNASSIPKNNSSYSQSYDNCDEIKYIAGRNYSSKPSLSYRLSGSNKIFVPVPNQVTFAWSGFIAYLKDLGLEVITVQQNFQKQSVNLGTVIGIYTIYEGTDFFKGTNVNDLGAVLNLLEATSTYAGSKRTAKITFVDFYNSYSWDYEIEIPTSFDKYKNALKNNICSYVSKNSSAKVILPQRKTCWNEQKIKQDFQINGIDQIEGIYENSVSSNSNEAKYKVAVKRISGKHYLIYLSGANNTEEWQEGEVKATLETTATPNFYKAKWIMANKSENNDFYVSFELGLMNVVDPDKSKSLYLKMYPTANDNVTSFSNIPASGTGFAITSNGLIVTNNHVIEGAKTIKVRGINGDFSRAYSAKLVTTDKNNDLAIIKIDDYSFTSLGTIPYIIKSSGSNVGENIFVLGYPLRATMGVEIKLTNGIISSKTGFQGDVTSYQISAPVQPGNSGGPLFDSQGNLIGIINAKHIGAENASYALKVSYLSNLIDLLEYPPTLQKVSTLGGKQLTQQVSLIKKFVYIIELN